MKIGSFKELVKYIRNDILQEGYNDLQICIYDDCVTFSIYEMFNVVIEVSKDKLYDEDLVGFEEKYMVKFKPEFVNSDMTVNEMEETSKICSFLEENIDVVTDLLS